MSEKPTTAFQLGVAVAIIDSLIMAASRKGGLKASAYEITKAKDFLKKEYPLAMSLRK